MIDRDDVLGAIEYRFFEGQSRSFANNPNFLVFPRKLRLEIVQRSDLKRNCHIHLLSHFRTFQ